MNNIIIEEPRQVCLSKKKFSQELNICLTIIKKPTKDALYYICEYVSMARYKSIVHDYVNK